MAVRCSLLSQNSTSLARVSSFVPIHKIEVYCFTWNNAIENVVCSMLARCCCAKFHLRNLTLSRIEDDGLISAKQFIFLSLLAKQSSHPKNTHTHTHLHAHIHGLSSTLSCKFPTLADAHVI